MENVDLQVLRAMESWRLAGRGTILATVVRTWGSSPRPTGSIMALRDDGAVVGSVSGGCIEDDLIQKYARGDFSLPPPEFNGKRRPVRLTYGVSADEAHRFGLPCGGTLELLIEFDPDAAGLSDLTRKLSSGQLVLRTLNLSDGSWTATPTRTPSALVIDDAHMLTTFGPEFRMIIIGAGQMAECLATMAQFSGFSVTVCDPREEFRSLFHATSAELTHDMPDDVILRMKPDRRTCVIALTHDPKLDDLALIEALETEAFYIGAIGSRRNQEARRRRMIDHLGQTAQSIQRLRGPIGIYIGSKTPPEIAVSVMADVLAAKNGVVLPKTLDVGHAKEMQACRDPGAKLPEQSA
jgi:xanthine dehydrogenase accessory factor